MTAGHQNQLELLDLQGPSPRRSQCSVYICGTWGADREGWVVQAQELSLGDYSRPSEASRARRTMHPGSEPLTAAASVDMSPSSVSDAEGVLADRERPGHGRTRPGSRAHLDLPTERGKPVRDSLQPRARRRRRSVEPNPVIRHREARCLVERDSALGLAVLILVRECLV